MLKFAPLAVFPTTTTPAQLAVDFSSTPIFCVWRTNTSKLTIEQRRLFEAVPQGVATLSPEELGTVLLEPHASWVAAIEKEWLSRYSR